MASADPAPIRFGTSGWRGILGEEFTFERLRAAVHGVARWFDRRSPGATVVVAHDTRFLGERIADTAAAVLAAHGLRPVRAHGAVPTPVAARAVARRRAAGALVFTASHNPPEYQGMKVFRERGRAIDDADARQIESLAARRRVPAVSPMRASPPVDLIGPYVNELVRLVDVGAFRKGGVRVAYDAMHGVGAGVLDGILERLGVPVEVLRADADPRFGGAAPDPSRERLRELARRLRSRRGRWIGLATDGDADRYAVLDSDGRMLSETSALALLVDHLARTGRARRGVAISIATGSLVERVANEHGLSVSRHPIGFKYLAGALDDGTADVAGEESGGFAYAGFGRDKDGMLAGCFMAELASGPGPTLRRRLDELHRRHGASFCGRLAVQGCERAHDALARMAATPPRRADGARVVGVTQMDGLRLELADGFLMLRASGTEPLLRVYAEAPGPRRLQRRLWAGARLLGAARRGVDVSAASR